MGKILNPDDLIAISKKNNLTVQKLDGMKYNLIKNQWTLSNDKSVNYISIFNKN